MPASLAVRAHWSVSTAAARKNDTSVTPGVHSLPENVLKLQQMNIPQRRFFNSSARLAISTGPAAPNASEMAITLQKDPRRLGHRVSFRRERRPLT